jgi:MFS family permease
MLSWYHELSTGERRTFWGCAAGWALDAMDVQLFSFVLPAIMLTLGITSGQAGLLGTSALISSAVGGWIAGVLADRYGRVRVLQWSILWYSVFTALSACAQSFDQLLVIRSLQGLGFGGEWAAGAVLMGEIIRAEHRGKAVGCVQSAYAVGWFAAALVSTIVLATLPAETAWRVVFLVGLLPALLVIYIRRHVKEPPLFARTLRAEADGARPGPFAIFAPGIVRTTVLACMLAAGVQGSSYAIIFWLPTFLRTVRHLTATGAGSYVMVVTLGAFCGYICSAYLTDAVGRRRNFLIYAIGCWVIDFAYMLLPVNNLAILLLGFPFGFFSQGIYASLGPYFTELFPTRIRATGQSFSYNFGRSIGAFFVTIVAILAQSMPLGEAIGVMSLGGYALAILATLFLPETQGIALEEAGMPQGRATLRGARVTLGTPGDR